MDKRQARAFERFVRESGDHLLRSAVLLTSNRQQAEDLYQETLQRLVRRWDRVEHPKAFCYRVMHNLLIDQARSRRRRPAELDLRDGDDAGDPRSTDPHVAADLRPALLAALDTLTPQQRAVVVLRYLDDQSEADVAELLGIAVGTVKTTAHRAVHRLRAMPAITGLTLTSVPERNHTP